MRNDPSQVFVPLPVGASVSGTPCGLQVTPEAAIELTEALLQVAPLRTVTTEEAAKILHACPKTVLDLIASDEIPAAKPGRGWVMYERDVHAYLRRLMERARTSPNATEPAHPASIVKVESRPPGRRRRSPPPL